MEKISIKIKMADQEFEIPDDTPDFSPILNYVIENEDYDVNNLTVISENENFDKDLFKSTFVDTLLDIKDKLKLDNEKLKAKLSEIDSHK